MLRDIYISVYSSSPYSLLYRFRYDIHIGSCTMTGDPLTNLNFAFQSEDRGIYFFMLEGRTHPLLLASTSTTVTLTCPVQSDSLLRRWDATYVFPKKPNSTLR